MTPAVRQAHDSGRMACGHFDRHDDVASVRGEAGDIAGVALPAPRHRWMDEQGARGPFRRQVCIHGCYRAAATSDQQKLVRRGSRRTPRQFFPGLAGRRAPVSQAIAGRDPI